MHRKLNSFFLFLVSLNLVSSQQRDCFCSQKFSLTTDVPINQLGFDWPPIAANDLRDTCDFKCARTCDERVRQLIGGDPQTVTLGGLEKMCEDVAPNRSVIKDGIVLWNYWNLDFCVNDRNALEQNVCCVYCKCKFVYYRAEEKLPILVGGVEETLIFDKDFSESVFDTFNQGRRAFKCDRLEHDRVCETSCRRELATHTDYQSVRDKLDQNR